MNKKVGFGMAPAGTSPAGGLQNVVAANHPLYKGDEVILAPTKGGVGGVGGVAWNEPNNTRARVKQKGTVIEVTHDDDDIARMIVVEFDDDTIDNYNDPRDLILL
jgi:hypothetical protein